MKKYIKFLKLIKKRKSFLPLKIKWSKKLYTKSDLLNLYRINSRMKKKEINRRIRATETEKYKPFLLLKNIKFEYCKN